MNKYTITRFLVTYNQENELEIINKEVNKHAPINRVLDRVGYFAFEFVKVDNHKYIVNYEEDEKDIFKSKLLISRTHPTEERLIDISEEDLECTYSIVERFMGIKL
jgi:hypothetical protein